MRLTQEEIEKIIIALSPYVVGKTELRLFGSRVKDHIKGGDIDLILLTEDEQQVEIMHAKKHILLAAIKKELGDQKIDLKIASQQDLLKDEFLKLVYPSSLILHIWKQLGT